MTFAYDIHRKEIEMAKERITISVDMMLIERIQVEADNQKRSLSNMIAYIIEKWLEQENRYVTVEWRKDES